ALSAAVEGTKSGQYPAGSKAILQAELTSAEQTASDSAATQAQVDHAGESLNNALQLFLGKQIAAIPGDVNGDGKVSIGDLGIISANYGLNSEDSSWNEIKRLDLNNDNVIDIMDLIVVARNILV
ncbi:hypothetical protein K0U00_30145, partial [Paenibacillus sepulcri]|nr:hypothetical protein [Paenibacillus sepulcri]